MKISYNWLKDYLECDLAPEAVAKALTSIGLEVDALEEIEEIPGGLAGVIVAEVVECVEHPDSDHLHVTKLNTGEGELLQVVCGAPNVAAGQKVRTIRIGGVFGYTPAVTLHDKLENHGDLILNVPSKLNIVPITQSGFGQHTLSLL